LQQNLKFKTAEESFHLQERRGMANEPNTNSILSKENAAYIAGIIDGEGCLSIYNTTVRSKGHLRSAKSGRSFCTRLQIVNTNSEIISWVHERIGGNVFCNRKRLPHERPIYCLTLNSNGLRWLLPQILKYAVGKRNEIEIVVKALGIIQTGKPQQYSAVASLEAELKSLHCRKGIRQNG
jgi:hypothetical protein